MTLASRIKQEAQDALKQLYPDVTIEISMIGVNQTKPEFTGDYTIVLFPFLNTLTLALQLTLGPSSEAEFLVTLTPIL